MGGMRRGIRLLTKFCTRVIILLCGYGGTGRRDGFRIRWATVQVQSLLPAFFYFHVKSLFHTVYSEKNPHLRHKFINFEQILRNPLLRKTNAIRANVRGCKQKCTVQCKEFMQSFNPRRTYNGFKYFCTLSYEERT